MKCYQCGDKCFCKKNERPTDPAPVTGALDELMKACSPGERYAYPAITKFSKSYRTRPGFLPVELEGGPSASVASGACVSVPVWPLVAMRLQRLIVPKSFASCFTLRGIVIGISPVFGGIGEVLCEVFWGDDERPEIPPIMLERTVMPGQVVRLDIRNCSACAMPFNAVFQTLEIDE